MLIIKKICQKLLKAPFPPTLMSNVNAACSRNWPSQKQFYKLQAKQQIDSVLYSPFFST